MKLSRYDPVPLAGMFLIFAVWAVFGFAYPASPLPIALNMISKVLAFAAAVSLFLPPEKAQHRMGHPPAAPVTATGAEPASRVDNVSMEGVRKMRSL